LNNKDWWGFLDNIDQIKKTWDSPNYLK
jgi:hypothetical protein